jgi:hypothetical protein
MGSYLWCVPDPGNPDEDICQEMLVEIDPPRLIPDPKIDLTTVPEEVITQIAVVVGIDRLAMGVQDGRLRAQLVETVDEMAAQLVDKLPSGVALKRADTSGGSYSQKISGS